MPRFATRPIVSFLFFLSLAPGALAATETLSDNISDATIQEAPVSNRAHWTSPVGVGGMAGTASGQTGYSFVVEGENHFTQRPTAPDVNQYGEGESRLELGNGIGVSLGATSGFTVYGLQDKQKVSPFLGVEPISGRIVLNTNGNRENYYEYLPMAAVGVQFAAGSCRILPLIRGGGAAGNLDKTGILPAFGWAYGAGTYIDCAGFDVSAESTRILRGGRPIDLRIADAYVSTNHGKLDFGLRGEQNREPDHTEGRVLLLLRSRIGS